MIPLMPSRPRLALVLLGCATAFGASAQQTPITGQMGSAAITADHAAATATPPPATQPAPVADTTDAAATTTEVGSTTRHLFAMQSQGMNAGPALPIPGPQASASYQRYVKSFAHPIPEFYETAVSKNSGGLSSASGTP